VPGPSDSLAALSAAAPMSARAVIDAISGSATVMQAAIIVPT